MKQIIQSYRTGELELAEVPAPGPSAGSLIVRTVCSVVSVGTERYMLDMAKKSLLGKAMSRPDLVRQVVAKARTEGVGEAYRQAMGRLDNPVPLGYSSAGVVLEIGSGVEGFTVGDRVACSGSGYASHAEIVRVPRNMAEKIPEGVGFEEAAFVTLGGIAIHGVRLAEPTFGERVVVLGLGLLGLIAVQVLKAAGCKVLGADVDPDKVRRAIELGADAGSPASGAELLAAVRAFSGGEGADAVLIFAATSSNEPIESAAEVCRERGRIVVPGLVGLDLPRKLFFEKELVFRVSRAWGPGLYDPNYEERGLDYPAPFVRWTARRNLGEYLELVASGRIRMSPLISHRFPFASAVEVYDRLLAGKERFTGVLLQYPVQTLPPMERRFEVAPLAGAGRAAPAPPTPAAPVAGKVRVGLVGGGLFAKGTLLPALKAVEGHTLVGIATASGVSGRHVARRYGFSFCATGEDAILDSPDVDLVMILTRHGSHARLAARALRAGKSVFVEKPLAIDEEQLAELIEAQAASSGRLMVGFNRRFAPTTRAALDLLKDVSGPFIVTLRANTGPLPRESWVHDPYEGGGPIIGEACHFVDLAQALTRSLPVRVHAKSAAAGGSSKGATNDVVITLEMADGSLATIVYTTAGDKTFPRERVEIFGGGAACSIENFRRMSFSRLGRSRVAGRAWTSVDRGYREEMRLMIEAVRENGAFPVPFEDYVATTRATFAAVESLRGRRPIDLPPCTSPS